jgi:hypothetical protein
MSATDVTALIAALRSGTVTLDEVAERFRRRIWQPTRPRAAMTVEERAAHRDPGGDVPGSFDEVTAAYDRGDLTSEQYDVLSEAVAEAINAEARRGVSE